MALKNIKKKEVVKLRQRALANGNVSLFLDINWKGDRQYDFLRLYLVDAKTTIDREQNKNTLLLAEQIRAQRLLDLQSGKHKIHYSKEHESFTDFFNECVKSRAASDGNHGNWKSAENHLATFGVWGVREEPARIKARTNNGDWPASTAPRKKQRRANTARARVVV